MFRSVAPKKVPFMNCNIVKYYSKKMYIYFLKCVNNHNGEGNDCRETILHNQTNVPHSHWLHQPLTILLSK